MVEGISAIGKNVNEEATEMETYLKPIIEIILLTEDDIVRTSNEYVEPNGGNGDGATFE